MTPAHTHKSAHIARLIPQEQPGLHPAHYRGYFTSFDAGYYYEAHDVLEELWLGCRGLPEYDFFKGLIQLAGCFVHLQKGRLRPAARLYDLAWSNIQKYLPTFRGLNITALEHKIRPYREALANGNKNPLATLGAPHLCEIFEPRIAA